MSTANMFLRRLRMLVDRAVLKRVSYLDAVRVMQIASRKEVVVDNIEHLEPAGFSAHPLQGAETIVVNLGGNSGRAVVIMVNDRRHRIVLEEGESAIYNMPHGDFVKVKKDRSIHVKSPLKVLLETPLVEATENLIVRGNAQFDGEVNATGQINSDTGVSTNGLELYSHRHSGVDTGSGTSGGPVP